LGEDFAKIGMNAWKHCAENGSETDWVNVWKHGLETGWNGHRFDIASPNWRPTAVNIEVVGQLGQRDDDEEELARRHDV